MALIVPNCLILRPESASIHRLEIAGQFQVAWTTVETKCWSNHNGYARVSISTPSKPRTTGKGSQSAHLHGHLSQLAIHFGYTLGEMKDVMKYDLPEWPRHRVRTKGGDMWLPPISESLVDTVIESKAIEWCHMRAAEEGMTLIEGEE